MAARIVTQEFRPLVIFCPPAKMEEFPASFADALKETYSFTDKFGAITDTRRTQDIPSPKIRHDVAAIRTEYGDRTKLLCVGAVVVMRNRVHQAIYTAVNWVQRPLSPEVARVSLVDAINWVVPMMTKAGIVLPPAFKDLVELHSRIEQWLGSVA